MIQNHSQNALLKVVSLMNNGVIYIENLNRDFEYEHFCIYLPLHISNIL